MGKAISIRLDEETLYELDKVASETNRSRTFLIKAAVRVYLEDYDDYRQALDRLLDKDDAIIAGFEMKKRLGL
jgi:predicted transcriptional regulator